MPKELILPQHLLDVQTENNEAIYAQVIEEKLEHYNKVLREIDPYLRLVKAKDDSDLSELKPGYWHLLKLSTTGLENVIVLEHEDGSFMQPGEAMFELIRRSDLWSERTQRERKDRQKALTEAKESERRRLSEDRVQETYERLRSANNASVGWTGALR